MLLTPGSLTACGIVPVTDPAKVISPTALRSMSKVTLLLPCKNSLLESPFKDPKVFLTESSTDLTCEPAKDPSCNFPRMIPCCFTAFLKDSTSFAFKASTSFLRSSEIPASFCAASSKETIFSFSWFCSHVNFST